MYYILLLYGHLDKTAESLAVTGFSLSRLVELNSFCPCFQSGQAKFIFLLLTSTPCLLRTKARRRNAPNLGGIQGYKEIKTLSMEDKNILFS